jgi:hypothetical protein
MVVQIHGHKVDGDPDGIHYLEHLTEGEAKTLFDEAHDHGKAKFRYNQKHYELAKTAQGTYVVAHIHLSSSIF